MYSFMSLFRETGYRPPAKMFCSMTSDRVLGLTEFVFAHRRCKLEAYSPTTVSVPVGI